MRQLLSDPIGKLYMGLQQPRPHPEHLQAVESGLVVFVIYRWQAIGSVPKAFLGLLVDNTNFAVEQQALGHTIQRLAVSGRNRIVPGQAHVIEIGFDFIQARDCTPPFDILTARHGDQRVAFLFDGDAEIVLGELANGC